MIRPRLITLCAGAAVTAVLGVWGAQAMRGDHPAAPGNAVDQVIAGRQVPPRPADSTWPLVAGGGAEASARAGVAATVHPSLSASRPHASAAPFVQDFAAQPGVKPLKPKRSPRAKVSVPANVDGCDHNYGTRTQCIPSTFPAGTTDKCGWLRDHGFTAITVAGTDRQRLDTDHNGTACDE